MKWFGVDDDDRMWVAGLPLSGVWHGDGHAFLEGFEPENPSLVVPRKYGLGWSLNLGAAAVKAGWIRPDDSLPDLADHIPTGLRKAIAIAPFVSGALTAAMSVAVAKQHTVASRWSFLGKPAKFNSGAKAAVLPVVFSGVVALLPRPAVQESQTAIDVAGHAEALGAQAVALAGLVASYQSAKHPRKRQFLAAMAPLLWPIVTGGVQIACVKTALTSINIELQDQHKERKES